MTTLTKYALGLILCLFTLTSCSETNTDSGEENYSETKKIIVDVLKSDDGKKAIEEILKDESIKTELVMNQEDVSKTIETALTSDKEKEFWENAFKDPKFVKALAKGLEPSHKQILKDLMTDPEYMALLTNVLKDSDMRKEFTEIMQGKDYRKELQSILTEIIDSPLYKAKIEDTLLKAADEKSKESGSNNKKEDQT